MHCEWVSLSRDLVKKNFLRSSNHWLFAFIFTRKFIPCLFIGAIVRGSTLSKKLLRFFKTSVRRNIRSAVAVLSIGFLTSLPMIGLGPGRNISVSKVGHGIPEIPWLYGTAPPFSSRYIGVVWSFVAKSKPWLCPQFRTVSCSIQTLPVG